jgi:hypothetical protein
VEIRKGASGRDKAERKEEQKRKGKRTSQGLMRNLEKL